MASARVLSTIGLLVAACLAALLLWAERAAALAPCVGADLYVVAHQDDTLLFQSPDLLEDVRSNRCVRTVFTTAGDAGREAEYAEGREAGAEAAYAQMAGVADVWDYSSVSLAGHEARLATLAGRPGISIVYLRLPDGGIDGEGFPLYGNQSLLKLWNGEHGESPAIAEIEADDESESYTYSGLVEALTAAIQGFGARQILTQNYEQDLPGPDHADHVITGRFVRSAAEALPPSYGGWRLTPYEDYEVTFRPPNVAEPLLAAKQAAFAAYIPFDEECQAGGGEECESGVYPEWLARQYVETSGIETAGLVADAGLERSAGAGSPVSLSGAGSSSENGGPLAYSWTQVGGPAVVINGANTVSPSLTTPPHPTLLTFALTVSQGVLSSAPDLVRVRVPSATPNPTAVVGPNQSVGAGATVTLDGSESWDPESLPLSYLWTQTGGPAVALSSPGASKPSFAAPSAAAASTLTFSLVVANGTETSAAASVQVAVAAGSDKKGGGGQSRDGKGGKDVGGDGKGGNGSGRGTAGLSRKRVALTVRKRSRRVVRATGVPARSCRGQLPHGAICRVSRAGNVVIEARRSLRHAGSFHLTIRFGSGAQPRTRSLKVVIKQAKK